MKKKMGRPKTLGHTFSITVSDAQLAYIEGRRPPDGTRAEAIRLILNEAISTIEPKRKRAS